MYYLIKEIYNMLKSTFAKRITSILLALILVLSTAVVFVGCKKDGIPDDLIPYNVDANGNPTSYYKNEYDKDGNLIKEQTYNSEGELISYNTNEFDDRGNKTVSVFYDKDGKVAGETQVEYNDQNLPTKQMCCFNLNICIKS